MKQILNLEVGRLPNLELLCCVKKYFGSAMQISHPKEITAFHVPYFFIYLIQPKYF
jgi:hypothetical protein